jgi:hypothetical protein
MPHKPQIRPSETVDAFLRRVESEHAATGGGAGAQPGDSQWVDSGFGFVEQQIWDGERWVSTGETQPIRDGGGGGGAGRTQFPSEAALDEAQTRLANATAALSELEARGAQPISPFQKQQLELERLRAENDVKTILMGEIGAERRTLIQEKGALQRELLRVGPDPFKQSAALSGQVVRGTTPQQAAVGQAQAFIDQPVPALDFNMTIPQMQAQLGQSIQAPTLAGGFGLPSLAEGGVIEMEKGQDGAFSQKQSFLVGEAGPEVLIVGGGKVEVVPFGGGAQGGLEISGLQALQPFFQGLGLSTIPTRTGFGLTGETMTGNFEALSRLGIQPEFVRDVLTGEIWKITGNTRQHITRPEVLAGINPASVVGAVTSSIARLAPIVGTPISALPTTQQIPSRPTPAFQALGSPLVEPTTGALLPAPFKIASQLGQFQRDRPDLFSNALSAFRAAGLDPFTVRAQMQAATPTGRSFRPQRIGFTGTRL